MLKTSERTRRKRVISHDGTAVGVGILAVPKWGLILRNLDEADVPTVMDGILEVQK